MRRKEKVLVFVASWDVLFGVPSGEKRERFRQDARSGQELWFWSFWGWR